MKVKIKKNFTTQGGQAYHECQIIDEPTAAERELVEIKPPGSWAVFIDENGHEVTHPSKRVPPKTAVALPAKKDKGGDD